MLMTVADCVNQPPPNPSPPAVSHGSESEDFGAVYQEHSQAIYYLALRYLGDPSRAEDVVHDVFLKAWKHLGDFRHESAWRTWQVRWRYRGLQRRKADTAPQIHQASIGD